MTNDILFPDSLVGYWPCDNSTAEDISTNNNDGTFNNNYEVHTGQVGGGLLLGAGDYMNTSFPADFGTGAFTVSAWVKFKEIINDHLLGTFDGGGWVLQVFDGNLRFYDGSNSIDATTGPQQDTWFHALWTRDDNGNSAIYINGNQDTTANNQGDNVDTTGTFRIGGSNDNAPDGYRAVYDEVRIWDREFTQTDVDRLTAYYARGSTSELYKNLKCLARMEQLPAKSSTPHINSFTTNGSPTVVSGFIGNAVDFDAGDDQLLADNSIALGNNQTVAMWVKMDDTVDCQLYNGNGGGGQSQAIIEVNNGNYRGRAYDGTDAVGAVEGPAVDTSQYVHLAYRYDFDAGEAEFFVDGVSQGTSTNLGNGIADDSSPSIAAHPNAGNNANAKIDEVYVYDEAIPDSHIQRLVQQRIQQVQQL